MGYFYECQDNEAMITAAGAGFSGYQVIQNPDAYGGYNVSFRVTGSLAHYHVHFASGGTRIKVVRYFSGAGGQGTNVIKHDGSGKPGTLGDLIYECNGYPNHRTLLQNLKTVVTGGSRNKAQELE